MKSRVLIVAVFLSVSVSPLRAATITVSSTGDGGPGSLRDALASAADGDTIDASLIAGTITLTSGQLQVTNSLSIIGPGPNLLAIDGNHAVRVFRVSSSNAVSISNLTITNGFTVGDMSSNGGSGIYNNHSTLTVSNCMISGNSAEIAGGIFNSGRDGTAILLIIDSILSSNTANIGGGILNGTSDNSPPTSGSASVQIIRSSVIRNSAAGGGGIYNDGRIVSTILTVVNSIVSSNSSSCTSSPHCGSGGAINNLGNATATLSNSIANGNSAGYLGGCIYNGGGTMQIAGTTINGNTSYEVGGIFNSGGNVQINDSTISSNSALGVGDVWNRNVMQIINSTLSGNSTPNFGGAIMNDGTLYVARCTFSGNSATAGASISGSATLENTILNDGGTNGNIDTNSFIAGTVTSLGHNLSSDDGAGFLTGLGDIINTDPMLGPLQDNGGPTFTHALLPGSPAIDAGNPSFTLPPDFDQRGPGFPRVVNGRIDIGAFEFTPDLVIKTVERIGNDLRLTFSVALLDKNYEVQSRTNLTFGTWGSLVGNIPGNGGTLQNTITNAFTESQQFYRIHQLP